MFFLIDAFFVVVVLVVVVVGTVFLEALADLPAFVVRFAAMLAPTTHS